MTTYQYKEGNTLIEIKNLWLLPLFYILPKKLLQSITPHFVDMPRHPYYIMQSEHWRGILTSDDFTLKVTDIVAFLIWPYFGVKSWMEAYSGYDPIWILAHTTHMWADALNDAVKATVADIFSMPRHLEMPWKTEKETNELFYYMSIWANKDYNLSAIREVVLKYRCIEDFDERKSNAKIDFYRKWYHTRVEWGKPLSLDELAENRKSHHMDDLHGINVIDRRASFEVDACTRMDLQAFMNTLKSIDKRIMQLRLDEYTLQEIADAVGLKTHSAVKKRLDQIGRKYKDYMYIP